MSDLILIIDDTTQNLQVLGKMLKNEGYNIAVASNGKEALDFVANRLPDLILLDVMMPGVNGYEVCKKLKSKDRSKRIPVIFISALNEIADKLEGFEAGGVDFITKPFQKQEVLARVKTHLDLKRNRERVKNYAKRLEKRNFELEKLQVKLNEELAKGKKLHQQFLPNKLPHDLKLSTAVYYQLAQKLGGDFYNFIEFNNQLIGYIVDITGHGLDGALLNIFVRETINSFLENKNSTAKVGSAEILRFIYHKYTQENFSDDYFICIGLFVLDKSTMNLVYSNAGLQFSPLVVKEEKVMEVDNKELPISKAIDFKYYEFKELEVELNFGDKFLLMTDGLAEETRNDKMYGKDRIKKLVEENKFLPIEGIINKIKIDFIEFSDFKPCNDDITLLGLEYNLKVVNKEVINVASDFKELETVKEKVKDFLNVKCSEFDEILIAFHEVLVNAMKHGNAQDENKLVKITVEVTNQYIKLSVEDEGSGFDWNNTLLKEEIYDNWSDSGRGLKIADLACDSMYYNSIGNKVFLVKLKANN